MTAATPGRAPAAIAYRYGNGLYLNITNRCPTACRFCVKRTWRWRYRGHDLRIRGREPTAEETLAAVDAEAGPFDELVFCGYGESTYRLPALTEICRGASARFPRARRRLNTIGLGSALWGRDIAPALKESLHAVRVSLNTADPGQWVQIHSPLPPYREGGYEAAVDFTRACVAAGLDTTVTAVEQEGVDLDAVAGLAASVGAGFLARPWL